MTTASIRSAVLRFAREHDLLRPGPLVIAVSGGTDSTALLLLLADLAPRLGLVLHVAHFDHHLRPSASAADAAFVADLAASRGATIRIGRADPAPQSEDEARALRYAFLRRAARELGAAAVATGHTRDDQAETVLLHLARGSGIAGLGGMRPARDGIVRPLLRIDRADTAAVCRAAGIAPREDPSNRSLRFARNRVRHKVLPELERLNPQVRAALARLADVAATVEADRAARAERALEVSREDGAIDLDAIDDELRDDALALAWERRRGKPLTARHRAALAALAAVRAGSASLDLPGGRVVREYATLRFAPPPAAAADPAPLAPGVAVNWRGWTIALVSERPAGDQGRFAVPAPEDPLVVRARRPGDRLAGQRGTKVQDVLTDAKVPARLRAAHPLVATASGAIWWVVGLECAAGAPTPGRWIVARPPAEHSWSSQRYTGSIDPDRTVVGQRGPSDELR